MQNQIQRITKEINGLKYLHIFQIMKLKELLMNNLIGKRTISKFYLFLFKNNYYKISKHRKAF